MNDNARQWVAALRSGEYEQWRGALRNEDRYCCLGVACDVYAKATGEGEWDGHDFIVPDPSVPGLLPGAVREWLGLAVGNKGWMQKGLSLTARNDAGATFAEIADLIESEPDGLFVEGE